MRKVHSKEIKPRFDVACAGSSTDAEAVLELRSSSNPLVLCRISPDRLLERFRSVKLGVFDFDQTLTLENQWVFFRGLLPDDLKALAEREANWIYSVLYDSGNGHHGHHEGDWWSGRSKLGKVSKASIEASWLSRPVERARVAKVTKQQVEAIGRRMTARGDIEDFFNIFKKRLVVSFGLADVIREFLRVHFLDAQIAATSLTFDSSDCVEGYHPASTVVAANKNEAVDLFSSMHDIPNEEIFAIGDSPFDIEMMPEGGCNFLILPLSADCKKVTEMRKRHLSTMWPQLDGIILSDSFFPLVELFREARS